MKKLLLIIILFIIGLKLGTVQGELIDVSPQCLGKIIKCEVPMYATCKAVICPAFMVYDSEGNYKYTEGGCNPCSYTTRCWCEGCEWYIQSGK